MIARVGFYVLIKFYPADWFKNFGDTFNFQLMIVSGYMLLEFILIQYFICMKAINLRQELKEMESEDRHDVKSVLRSSMIGNHNSIKKSMKKSNVSLHSSDRSPLRNSTHKRHLDDPIYQSLSVAKFGALKDKEPETTIPIAIE
jgi:hypothetical protein